MRRVSISPASTARKLRREERGRVSTWNIAKSCQGNVSLELSQSAQSQPPQQRHTQHATLNPLRAASQRGASRRRPSRAGSRGPLSFFRVEMYTRPGDRRYISHVVNLLRLLLTCSSTIGAELRPSVFLALYTAAASPCVRSS